MNGYIPELLAIAGVIAIVAGVALWSIPLACIVAGVALIGLAGLAGAARARAPKREVRA